MLCQLSYSHRNLTIIATAAGWSERRSQLRFLTPLASRGFGTTHWDYLGQFVLGVRSRVDWQLAADSQTRPTPTYSNPSARRRVGSSRFFVSTMTGVLSR